MNPSPDRIPAFLAHFRVCTETPAYHEMVYNPHEKKFTYAEPDVDDNTTAVLVYDKRAEEDDDIEELALYIPSTDELKMVGWLSGLFADVEGNIEEFIERAKKDYT